MNNTEIVKSPKVKELSVFEYEYKNEDTGESADVLIDLQNTLSYVYKEDDGTFELVIKFSGDSKSIYEFPNREPLDAFVLAYKEYIKSRPEIIHLAKDMRKDIVTELTKELQESQKKMTTELQESMAIAMKLELDKFNNTVASASKSIVDVALNHQKEINAENKTHLESIRNMEKTTTTFMSEVESLTSKLGGIVSVVNDIVPSASHLLENEKEEAEILEKETATL